MPLDDVADQKVDVLSPFPDLTPARRAYNPLPDSWTEITYLHIKIC